MKPALTKDNTTLYHYRDGVRREGKNFFMRGDCSRLRGVVEQGRHDNIIKVKCHCHEEEDTDDDSGLIK